MEAVWKSVGFSQVPDDQRPDRVTIKRTKHEEFEEDIIQWRNRGYYVAQNSNPRKYVFFGKRIYRAVMVKDRFISIV